MQPHDSVEPDGAALALEAPASTRAWRHPVVLTLGPVVAALCVARYGAEPSGFITGLAAWVLVVLSATDLEQRMIPNRIVLPAAAAVVACQVAFYPDRAVEWILAPLGAAFFLFVPGLFRAGAIGGGDVKLALLMGATVGAQVLAALTVGFLAMMPVALFMLVRRGSEARQQYLPLGPFLAFGTLFVVLTGAAA